MQIETFQIFCDLVETASFSRVAEIHGMTQSAVSQQIRSLEKKFLVTLIERGKKNFSVTEEGQAMLVAAREILGTYHSLEKRLQELQTHVAGQIQIAAVHSIGLHELPPYLKIFRKKYPEVEMELQFLRSAQVYQAVLDGRVDIGLVAFPAERKGLEIESFWHDKLVLICPPSHRLAKCPEINLSDLEGEKFVSFSYDQPTRKAIDSMLAGAGVKIQMTMEFDNIEMVKRVVEIEAGIAIVPRSSVKMETQAGSLRSVEISGANMWRPLGLLIKRNKALNVAQQAFIRLLHARQNVAESL